MGHSIRAFLFRGELDAALAARLPAGALCPLTQGVIALAQPEDFGDDDSALAGDFAHVLETHSPEPGDATALHQPDAMHYLEDAALSLAARLADGRPFAYVETNYFGGAGEQHAALWRDGGLCLPRDASAGSARINEVLRAMGVTITDGVHDEFEAIGLHVMRSNDAFSQGLEARLHRAYGARASGRYLGPSGALELRARDGRVGRWIPERERWIPWRVTVAGTLVDSESARAYTLVYEHSGTPGLRRHGDAPARLYYNDGPHLVHDPTRAGWRRHVGEYRADDGARVSVRMDKQQLYLDETRLLPVARDAPTRPDLRARDETLDDDRFVTGRLEPVEFVADTLLLHGARYRRR